MKVTTVAISFLTAAVNTGPAGANDVACSVEIDRISSGLAEYEKSSLGKHVLSSTEQENLLRQKVGERFPAECFDELSSGRISADVLRTPGGVLSISGGEVGHRYGFAITPNGTIEGVYVIFK
jgi:hypothetical protein